LHGEQQVLDLNIVVYCSQVSQVRGLYLEVLGSGLRGLSV